MLAFAGFIISRALDHVRIQRDREGWELKRTTHLVSGMAVGAVAASAMQGDFLTHMIVGAVFGLVPDLDLIIPGLGRKVHRSPASHSLMASFMLAIMWLVALTVLRSQPSFDFVQDISLPSTSVVVFFSSFLHAAEDSLTVYGTRLLFPISKRTFRGPARYDDYSANIALSALAILVILLSLEFDISGLL